jgi:hypothetical protein
MNRVPSTYRPKRALYMLAAIPDEAPPELKKALAIRNACATQLCCPDCGAEPEIRPPAHLDGVWHATFRHEPDCACLLDEEAA